MIFRRKNYNGSANFSNIWFLFHVWLKQNLFAFSLDPLFKKIKCTHEKKNFHPKIQCKFFAFIYKRKTILKYPKETLLHHGDSCTKRKIFIHASKNDFSSLTDSYTFKMKIIFWYYFILCVRINKISMVDETCKQELNIIIYYLFYRDQTRFGLFSLLTQFFFLPENFLCARPIIPGFPSRFVFAPSFFYSIFIFYFLSMIILIGIFFFKLFAVSLWIFFVVNIKSRCFCSETRSIISY